MSKKSTERLICEDYVKKFPEMKLQTLAKRIVKEVGDKYPKLRDYEKVRKNYLLTVTGTSGKRNREAATDKSLFKEKTHDTSNAYYKEQVDTGAKILILDIETLPAKAFIWDVWRQNIQPNQITNDWFIVTWAAKWLFEDKIYSGALTPKEAKKQTDKRIMQSLWKLLNEADIVIAHNAKKFDVPRINTRFLLNKMHPPSPFIIIDTLIHYQRNFSFLHNKLDYINMRLELPRKEETGGFELWEGCYNGEQKSLDKMLHYNVGDVKILESNYLILRPWIRPHPNVALHILDEKQHRCPTCGSADLKDEGKNYHTTANIYGLMSCNNCGASSRKRLSSISIKQRRHLLLSTAK